MTQVHSSCLHTLQMSCVGFFILEQLGVKSNQFPIVGGNAEKSWKWDGGANQSCQLSNQRNCRSKWDQHWTKCWRLKLKSDCKLFCQGRFLEPSNQTLKIAWLGLSLWKVINSVFNLPQKKKILLDVSSHPELLHDVDNDDDDDANENWESREVVCWRWSPLRLKLWCLLRQAGLSLVLLIKTDQHLIFTNIS